MDVATLKQQARSLEQQGDSAQALAIYRKILAHVEGTPAIKQELPLYVKAGDLSLKLGDTKSAVAMYGRAARRYAEYGSAQSVNALCAKILRIAPRETHLYPRLAGLMVKKGFVGAAREVLARYAKRTNQPKGLQLLERLAGRGDDELRPILEKMLAAAERREKTLAQRAAQSTTPTTAKPPQPTPEPVRPTPAPAPAPAPPVAAQPAPPEPPQKLAEPPAREAPLEPVGPVTPPEVPAPLEIEKSEPIGAVEVPAEPAVPAAPIEPARPAVPKEETAPPEVEEPAAMVVDEPEPAAAAAVPFMADVPELEPATELPPEPDLPERAPEQVAETVQALEVRTEIGEDVRAPAIEEEPVARPKKSRALWIGMAAAVVVVAGIGLVASGVIPLGGGGGGRPPGGVDQPSPPTQDPGALAVVPADTGEQDTTAMLQADSLTQLDLRDTAMLVGSLAQDTAGADTAATLASDTAVAGLTNDTVVVAQDTLQPPGAAEVAIGDTTTSPDTARAVMAPPVQVAPAELPADTASSPSADTAPPPPPAPVTAPVAFPPGVPGVDQPIIVVAGLAVEDVSEFSSNGETGFRVVQLLESGERLTLTMLPFRGDTTERSEGRVTAVAPDSAVGTVRFRGYLIEVRARVATDILQDLLRRLVEVGGPN